MRMRGLWAIPLCLALNGCTIGRMVVHGFSDIKDYKRFPDRDMPAAPQPWRFAEPSADPGLGKLRVPFQEGISSLDSVLEQTRTVAFLVIRHDSLLFERYLRGYQRESWVASFSMAKSYTSALVGAAIADGKIGSIEDYAHQYLPELKETDLADVKIRHLLEMTANIKHAENYFNPFAGVARLYYGKHLPKQIDHLHHAKPAGSGFVYQSVATQYLGEIVARATGRDLTDYLHEKVWRHLGAEYPASWSIDQRRNGREKAFCGINATARDFAKFGRLYLNMGSWDGTQVLPSEWVKASTAINEADGSAWHYGYQWWLASRDGDYMAQGHLGQFIYVHPAHDIIIVRLGQGYGRHPWRGTFTSIVNQIKAG